MNTKLQEIFDYYKSEPNPSSQENIVAMLREIQELFGCIPPDVQALAANALGVKLSVITCIIRLYPSLTSSSYQHRLTICTGARCGGKGGMELLNEARRLLKVDDEGISQDGRFFLCTQNCLKHCATSPNIQIDDRIYSQMTVETLRKLLSEDLP